MSVYIYIYNSQHIYIYIFYLYISVIIVYCNISYNSIYLNSIYLSKIKCDSIEMYLEIFEICCNMHQPTYTFKLILYVSYINIIIKLIDNLFKKMYSPHI